MASSVWTNAVNSDTEFPDLFLLNKSWRQWAEFGAIFALTVDVRSTLIHDCKKQVAVRKPPPLQFSISESVRV